MPMECPSHAILAQYATGELSEAEAAVVDTHIGTCTTCLERMNSFESASDAVLAALRQLPQTPPSDSQTLTSAIVASVRRARGKSAPGLARGTELSGYRIVEELGRGGMGRVYRAAHPRLDQEVALKVLRPGLDSTPILARFEAERQALARMDHPNIARVLDGGATSDGQPFFAMELVRGVAVTRYCDDGSLDLRGRLHLFVSICRAVQHAHQKGIIHRDLKPSNVLIAEYDGKPTVKVIDFGVAKAADRPSEADTEIGVLVGTPESMSPEQAKLTGHDIDTRTDVYALGGILYELLAGDTPLERQRLRATPVLEVLRIVREEEPPTPSARLAAADSIAEIAARRGAEPGALIKQVRGDLDRIAMKAIEKDRNRRYESASAFADDVERFLNDEPVLASPPSATYRFQKFARRNKGKLTAAAVLGIASMVAVSAIGWAARDRSARDEAALRTQADRKVRVEAQIQIILDEVARLERAEQWQEALVTARRAADLLSEDGIQPDVAESVRDTIRALELVRSLETIRADKSEWKDHKFDYRGTAESYAARFRDAGVDLERQTPDQAAERLRTRSPVLAALIPALDDWALCRNSIGDKAGGLSVLKVAGLLDWDPWRQKVRNALRTWDEPALIGLAVDTDLARQPAATFEILSVALLKIGRIDTAIGVLSLARRQHPNDFWVHFEFARALDRNSSSSLEQAAGCFRTALGLRPKSTAAWNNLGNVLLKQGKQDEAMDCFRKSIEIDPGFASGHLNLGRVFFERKNYPNAIACFRKAIDLNPKSVAAHTNLGVVLSAQNKFGDAAISWQRAIELDPQEANAYHGVGVALLRLGKVDDAIVSLQKAVELDPDIADAHHSLANALWKQKKLDEAIASYRRAIELDPNNATVHSNLGNVLYWQEKFGDATACFRKAVELDPKLGSAHYNLGVVLLAQKKVDDAVDSLNRAIELDPDNASIHNILGNARLEQMKLDDAIVSYRKAIELNPKNAGAHCNLGNALSKQGKFDDAIAWHKRAIELDPKLATAHSMLGVILCDQKKDYDGAIAAFRRAIALRPKTALDHYNLGVALHFKGDAAGAIAASREAVRVQPTFAKAQRQLAQSLSNSPDHELRDPKEALIAATKAVELEAQSPLAWQVLGWAHYRSGDWNASIAALEKSIALSADPKGGDAYQWFFLAMAHRKLDNKEDARRWYDKAVVWMNEQAAARKELHLFRAEAEEVLEIKSN